MQNDSHPIVIKDLYFRYSKQKKNVLNGVNLIVGAGEVVAIAGLSGCGKSTLCYCIAGLAPNLVKGRIMGEILIFSKDVSKMDIAERTSALGIVFQEPDDQLFSPTIEDEIAFGPENLCFDREEIGRRIDDALNMVSMQEYRFSSPDRLSGGQKQLIALASVLSMKPRILIFDETMSQIDKQGKKLIKDMIVKLKQAGNTVLMVEHDFDNMDIADRIMVMKDGKLSEYDGNV